MLKFYHSIVGVSSLIGQIVEIDEWAKKMKVPDRKSPGNFLTGEMIRNLMGIHSKSWDPDLFRTPSTITEVARQALESAELEANQIDAFIVVSCTPYEIKLGQDGFRFARDLGLKDSVAPIQIEAGCGGLARVGALIATLNAERVLVLAYNTPSLLTPQKMGIGNLYGSNQVHPFGHILWGSPAIFSDGAGALVFERDPRLEGFAFYSRDQMSFGSGPGFTDPIVHHPGGGSLIPPGTKNAEEMSAFAMSGRIIKEYYLKGMKLNHDAIVGLRSSYGNGETRTYIHQAGPALVQPFLDSADIPRQAIPTHASRLGNLVSPCTIKLFHDDLVEGIAKKDKEIVFSLVGAGPERGYYLTKNAVRKIMPNFKYDESMAA